MGCLLTHVGRSVCPLLPAQLSVWHWVLSAPYNMWLGKCVE